MSWLLQCQPSCVHGTFKIPIVSAWRVQLVAPEDPTAAGFPSLQLCISQKPIDPSFLLSIRSLDRSALISDTPFPYDYIMKLLSPP